MPFAYAKATPVPLRASAFQPKPSVLVRRSPMCYTDQIKNEEMKKEIQEIFQIQNRGAVAVLGEITDRIPGKPYKVQVILSDGRCLKADAFKEWILRTNPKPVEKEAYILSGLNKADITLPAFLKFI
jgi:hypothetical protein